jgi:phosphopantothenoylcysteine synthetase/decarboxylase
VKLLFTSGATREPIDEVRFITNVSTGLTGSFLADFLDERGHEVVFLAGEGSKIPRRPVRFDLYFSFLDLDSKLRELLAKEKFDGIIHLAAVSDYSVEKVEMRSAANLPIDLKKIDSDGDLTVRLKRNFKIVSRLKRYAAPENLVVVAFKLTNSLSYDKQMAAITKLSLEPDVDFVVHNDLHDIKEKKEKRFRIFKNEKVLLESLDRTALAVGIEQLIRSQL